MDRFHCRLSKEEYDNIHAIYGYGKQTFGDYCYYTHGGYDNDTFGDDAVDRYKHLVNSLEQAEKVKLLQEALDI